VTAADDVDVTVSIVNHENREGVLTCLSGLAQDTGRRASLQVIVVDNASGDGSAAAIRRRFDWVQVVERQDRAGFGANHNLALSQATGRHVLMLNDDTSICPGAIDTLVGVLDRDAALAVAAPRVLDAAGEPQASAWRQPSPLLDVLVAASLGRLPPALSAGSQPRRVGWALGCALLARRDALLAAGGFDEEYFMYCEEIDLSRRLAGAGLATVWVPAATAVHAGQVSTGGHGSRARAVEMARSRRAFWERHYSTPGRLCAQLSTSAMFGLLALAAGARRRDWAPFWLQARESWHRSHQPGLHEEAAAFNATMQRSNQAGDVVQSSP
jgi:N-acetylglucosaminyl-diphospho-decaprenol L-rhamnosyltransferase